MIKPLLVLDIDETLLYCNYGPRPAYGEADFIIKDVTRDMHGWFRPHLFDFLEEVGKHYDLAIWTTGTLDYAKEISAVLSLTDSIKFAWGRERCAVKFMQNFDIYTYRSPEPIYLKNLSKVKRSFKFPLEKILVIDDTPEKHLNNYGNLIPIKSWLPDAKEDDFLKKATEYLVKIKDHENFRSFEKRNWYTNAVIDKPSKFDVKRPPGFLF